MTSYTRAIKRNISSMQVLKTLSVLLEDNYSMADLIKILNKEESEPVFNNSVISKYINTCRACGIKIPKIHNKYFVASLPFGLSLTSKDLNVLKEFQYKAKDSLSEKQNNVLDKFLTRLNKYSNKNIMRVEKDTLDETHKLFYRAVSEQRKIRLMFRIKNTIECVPVDIVEHGGRTFFSVIDKNKEKLVCEDRISGIELTDSKFVPIDRQQEVEFILKGDLALRYSARENEEVTTYNGYISVVNKGENKELLLSRLLRYDTCCEIVRPLAYREEMKKIISDALSNYGE